jgi:hypothetical protein
MADLHVPESATRSVIEAGVAVDLALRELDRQGWTKEPGGISS